MTDDECEAPSSPYETRDVDFEIIGVMWLPPDPEYVEDDMEGIMFEDDDDETDTLPLNSPIGVPLQSSNRTPDEHVALKEEFLPPPSDHLSISVSLSSRCVWNGTFCERPHSICIKYYSTFDEPLGRFLREQLFDQSFVCHSCEMPVEAHVYGYTHQHGTLTITVKKLPGISLPGERKEDIWMWHRCLRCPRTNGYPPSTRRVLMSDAEWGLSLGKFLEQCFSKHGATSRVVSCGHSFHRDCLRFYGIGQVVACFHYAKIDVHSVCLPPAKLDFNYKNQDWIEKEINEVVGRAEFLFSEVQSALRLLEERTCGRPMSNSGMEVPESRHVITELEGLLQKEKTLFEERLHSIMKREAEIGHLIDILELNRLLRELVLQSYVWDQRLIYATSLDSDIEPNEMEVTSLKAISKSPGGTRRVIDVNLPVEIESAAASLQVHRSLLVGHTPIPSVRSFDDREDSPSLWSGYNPVYISSFQGGPKLLLPMGVNDTVIPVYDDEPTSIISHALVSHEYFGQFSSEDSVPSLHSLDPSSSSLESDESKTTSSLNPMNKTMDVTVSFTDDGKVKYSVTCYNAKQFESLRMKCCPTEMDFIRSLSRCKKWGGLGRASNVFLAKTLDDRFIIKQVRKSELESFIRVAPDYFKYLSESISRGSPTCLAKILGIYQVSFKPVKGGKETKMDMMVMENLMLGRNITRLYDLKGSSRSRYNPDSSGSNTVLLDQNLIEAMPTSPIFVGNEAKRSIERAVWNDTSLLASIDVMDYSLLVGVDEEKHELVLGIINFMRQYTWDKHLESWVTATGILGGPKNASPTVISPMQYKKRFRKAMNMYFLMVPDWATDYSGSLQPSRTD